MRSAIFVSCALALSVAAGLGCSSGRDEATGDSAALTDEELALAKSAVAIVAGADGHCNKCHTASRNDILRWGQSMIQVELDCFRSDLTPEGRVSCLSSNPSDPEARFTASRLGFYSAATKYNAFRELFTQAGQSERFDALQSAAMPSSDFVPAISEQDFLTIQRWVFGGMRGLDEATAQPITEECKDAISPDLLAHVKAMKSEGWGARLHESSVPMLGCGAANDPKACLTDLPDVTPTYGAAGVAQTLRNLRTLDFKSHYWVRSSADGRYVGFGLANGANIIDLAAGPNVAPLEVDASYDPVFLPNNDGVSFAGVKSDGSIRVCRQNVIADAFNKEPRRLTLLETGCSSLSQSVYQSFGASLDGALFWMTTGDHANDDGGHDITRPLPGFEEFATTIYTPMLSDGVSYQPKASVQERLPAEGDQMLSPSSRLMVTRFGSEPGHRGYRIRRLNVSETPGAFGAAPSLGVSTDVVGTVCVGGGKGMFSFDERFLVTHEYLDRPTDGSADVRAANIVLADLVTGDLLRVTNVAPNQFALYPHFRADGWLYFLVRDMNTGVETLVASDVAVRRLEQP